MNSIRETRQLRRIRLEHDQSFIDQLVRLNLPTDIILVDTNYIESPVGVSDFSEIILQSSYWSVVPLGEVIPYHGYVPSTDPSVTKLDEGILASYGWTAKKTSPPKFRQDGVFSAGVDLSKAATCICDFAYTGLKEHRKNCPKK